MMTNLTLKKPNQLRSVKYERIIIRPMTNHRHRCRCQEVFSIPGQAPEFCLNRAVYDITLVNLPDRDKRIRVCQKHLDIYIRLKGMLHDIPHEKGRGLL